MGGAGMAAAQEIAPRARLPFGREWDVDCLPGSAHLAPPLADTGAAQLRRPVPTSASIGSILPVSEKPPEPGKCSGKLVCVGGYYRNSRCQVHRNALALGGVRSEIDTLA